MRKLLTTFVCVWFTLAVWAGDGIYEKLQQIPQISEIQKLDVKPFQEYYQFWFEQSIIPIPQKGLSGNGCCWGINNRMLR